MQLIEDTTSPVWMQVATDETLASFRAGELPTCEHAPVPGRDQVMVIGWLDDVATCNLCRRFRYTSERRLRTCTCCEATGIDGRVCLSNVPDEKFAYAAILCPDCRAADGL